MKEETKPITAIEAIKLIAVVLAILGGCALLAKLTQKR
jgi:hypothetical protein